MWNAADYQSGDQPTFNLFAQQRWQSGTPPRAQTHPSWSATPAPSGAAAWGLGGQLLALDRPMPFLRFQQQAQRAAPASQTATLGEPLLDPAKFGL